MIASFLIYYSQMNMYIIKSLQFFIILFFFIRCSSVEKSEIEDMAEPLHTDSSELSEVSETGGEYCEIVPDEQTDVTSDNPEPDELQIFDKTEEIQVPLPPVIFLTVDEIPETMNGSKEFTDNDNIKKSFHLLVPGTRFVIDVYVVQGNIGEILPEKLIVTLNKDIPGFKKGESIGKIFKKDPESGRFYAMITENEKFPAGSIEVNAFAVDLWAQESNHVSFKFETDDLTEDLDPFDKNEDWLLITSRDFFSITPFKGIDGNYKLEQIYKPSGNGIPDLIEDFKAGGLMGNNEDFNDKFLSQFREKVLNGLHELFLINPDGSFNENSVRIRFFWEDGQGAPQPENFSPSGTFSMIGIGGDAKVEMMDKGYLGYAHIDKNNKIQNDDSGYGYGVFTSAILKKAFDISLITGILMEFSPIDGTPLGDYEGDMDFLKPGFEPDPSAPEKQKNRYELFKIGMELMCKGFPSLIAHEMGHSLGLVPPGAPPSGMFGGAEKAEFISSPATGWHIDIPGLNIMQSGSQLKIEEALGMKAFFEPLSIAYMQRRLIIK
jgi:hypothetical protein